MASAHEGASEPVLSNAALSGGVRSKVSQVGKTNESAESQRVALVLILNTLQEIVKNFETLKQEASACIRKDGLTKQDVSEYWSKLRERAQLLVELLGSIKDDLKSLHSAHNDRIDFQVNHFANIARGALESKSNNPLTISTLLKGPRVTKAG